MPKKKNKTLASEKQSKSTWLDAALDLLIRGGINAVRVEVLAKNLGVTKGSFYWHFQDRNQLLEQMLDHWVTTTTAPVMEGQYPDDPVARIYAVGANIVDNERARLDPQIRAWALTDKNAERKVREVDQSRFSFLNQLFREAGFNSEDAELRSRLFYYYLLAEHLSTLESSMKLRTQRLEKEIKLLLR